MAIDTPAKRASVIASPNTPWLRLVHPEGAVNRAAAAGMYAGFAGAADATNPTVTSATINASGTSLTIGLSETVNVNAGSGFTVNLSGGPATVTYVSGSGSSSLAYSISRTVIQGETGTLSYATVANGIEDAAGNDLLSFLNTLITNDSSQIDDATPPNVTSATINAAGTQITFATSEDVEFGADGSSGFALNLTGGAVTLSYVSGEGSSALLYSLSRVIDPSETGTHAYTQPGDGVVDTAFTPNPLATYSGATVTNNSEVGDLEAGAIVFTPAARSPRNPGAVYVLQTRPGDVTKITIDWSTVCAGEDTTVQSASWEVTAGDMTLGAPTTSSNKSTILVTTPQATKGQLLVTATMSDGQRDVVCIVVRCRSFPRN